MKTSEDLNRNICTALNFIIIIISSSSSIRCLIIIIIIIIEGEGIVDAPGNDGNASMPVKVKRPNPWRKIIIIIIIILFCCFVVAVVVVVVKVVTIDMLWLIVRSTLTCMM
jgi:hypothetical protein